MHFTRLRLTGFKSFVDPTELVINDGLTGVVGPNGCGKSNLLEALRWVMGENRPTAMRGGGMEDVIFAGAASRAARNFAEVSLGVDNSERLAPAEFNDADQLEIVRRITRDIGSAYKVNGKDVRARDVQMLFADAATGAHSPALVRQGQIAELINARPKSRRRVLEDAAGIGGLYQRRHEAELKLTGAETNLARVQDVIEQLAAQLRDLARQARQAERYRAIGTDLRHAEGVLLFVRWSNAEAGRERAQAALRAALTDAGQAERGVTGAARDREAAEAAVPPLREEEAIAAAVLQRLQVEQRTLAERAEQAETAIETLGARIAQLDRDAEREAQLNHDAGEMLGRLADEEDRLRAAQVGHGDKVDQAATASRAAAEALKEAEATHSVLTEDAARLVAQHKSAARLVQDATAALSVAEGRAARARAEVESSVAAETAAKAGAGTRAAALDAASRAAQAAETALEAADQRRNATQSREAEARAERSKTEGEVGALSAEFTALERLVARETGSTAQLIDALSVAPGFELALGAALADDLRAPVVGAGDRTGWVPLDDYADAPALPGGLRPISDHVTAPAALARRLAQVAVVDRAHGPALQADLRPGQRLVSREGDLWRWDGLRTDTEDASNAAALRLQQINRIGALKEQLREARAKAEGTVRAHEVLKQELAAASDADKAARDARRAADSALADASRAASRAAAEHEMAMGRLETLRLSVSRHDEEVGAARARTSEASAALKALPDAATATEAAEAARAVVAAARDTMLQARASHEELRRAGEGRRRRLDAIAREAEGWNDRLSHAGTRLDELGRRRADLQAELDAASDLPAALEVTATEVVARIDTARTRRQTAGEALARGENALRDAQAGERSASETASKAREVRAAAQERLDAAGELVNAAAARIAEDLESTPDDLRRQLADDAATGTPLDALEARVGRLRRQREALGAVNLRAEEDARTVQDEHDLLVSEKADLEEAISKLRSGIAGLNREGRERLLSAFEQVNTHFARLFTHLFGGGEARLALVESDDPLEAGLEILCQPPGKKLSTLSLLSGGEQTLTAMALIFGVFLSNPAPICVLDEVDAPLDDANVGRFCDLLEEMTRSTDTRFLIITHHAVTMARMDRLFGVTMGEKGVSQLVSVDLKLAESLVA